VLAFGSFIVALVGYCSTNRIGSMAIRLKRDKELKSTLSDSEFTRSLQQLDEPAEYVEAVGRRMLKEQLVEASGDDLLLVFAALASRPRVVVTQHRRQVAWTSPVIGRRCCHDNHNKGKGCLCVPAASTDRCRPGTSAGFWLGGSVPPVARENFENLTTKWCILKYI